MTDSLPTLLDSNYHYPMLEPFERGHVEVTGGHRIYFEQSGTGGGLPVVYLHGGPGMGLEPHVRRLFDPEHYRLVQFDQRGCGQSRPFGCVENNTTWDLVGDIERLRVRLGIERWLVMGQSWGCALALAYAERHPSRVERLMLQGVFLGTRTEMDWIRHNWRMFHPEAWRRLASDIELEDPDRLHEQVALRLATDDETVRRRALEALTRFELACCYLKPPPSADLTELDLDFCAANTLINIHYVLNNFWLEPDQLIRDSHRAHAIPLHVINGRFDIVTPIGNAWRLTQVWPGAELRVVDLAGHHMEEAENIRAATRLLDEIKSLSPR